uniref:Putative ag-outcast-2 n=1 Tax=Anopheles darlingi TaxID=43151 RepID=A0A2M4CVR3_ANODA
MGVSDPGGGIPLRNDFAILAETPNEKKRRKIGQYTIPLEEVHSNDGEQIMLMEAANTGKDLSSVSPFLLGKIIETAIGGKPLEARRLRDGKILVRVKNIRQAKKLEKIKMCEGGKETIPINVIEHPTLNQSKGVVRCDDILFMEEKEIQNELKSQNVTEVQIIKRKDKDGKLINTKLAIITFKSPRIPRKIDFGLYPVKVELYIPSPMRCTMCMRLGHTKKRCHREQACAKCSKPMHKEACTETKCVSCGDNHHTLDKNCPVYIDECEIQRIRTEKKIPYGEAKRIRRETCPVIPRSYTTSMSYANTLKSTQKETTSTEGIAPIKGTVKGASISTITQVMKEQEPREHITKLTKKMNMDIENITIMEDYNSYAVNNDINAKEIQNNTETKNMENNNEGAPEQEYYDNETKYIDEAKGLNQRIKKARTEDKDINRLDEDETSLKKS